MAGPTASILLPHVSSSELVASVLDKIRGIASSVDAGRRGTFDSFWIRKQPFIVSFGPDYPEEFDDLTATGLPDVLGWTPRDAVGFAAMCNGSVDHRILAEICLRLAGDLGGVIDFNGNLAGLPVAPRDRETPALRIERPEGLAGTLFLTPYPTIGGLYGCTHLGDAELLATWMEHPGFHMCK